MIDTNSNTEQALYQLLRSCLEDARIEVIRRLKAQGRPLSAEVPRLLIMGDERGGWRSDLVVDKVSGIYPDDALYAIGDLTVRNRIFGLRDQLLPVAEYLLDRTDIGTKRYSGVLGQDPIDGLLFRCVSPLAHHYLTLLSDLARPRPSLVRRLASELYELATNDVAQHVYHLSINGVNPARLYTHRGVSIRPLTPRERGSWYGLNAPYLAQNPIGDSDYLPTAGFPMDIPSTLLEVVSRRDVSQQFDTSTLPNKLALAFYLLDYELSSPGVITQFDRPVWAAMGRHTNFFPVSQKAGRAYKELDRRQFSQVVDLAYQIPDFSSRESSSREIVLWRVLRGCGMHWIDSSFIDFAIALEAALLMERGTELSYRFSLYGSLFLNPERDPADTFKRLKDVYSVRSKLVHGGTVRADMRNSASQDAARLAKAIVLKALRSGWPDADALDALALSFEVR